MTFSVYTEAGIARETDTSLTETPASSGLYLGTATLLVTGDNVVIKDGSAVVGHGQQSIEVALETTILDANPDGSNTDVTFTLSAGSTDDDEYNNMVIAVTDVSGGVVSARRAVDYVGASKKVSVDAAFEFPLADGDRVRLWASTYSQTADAAAISDIADAVWNETQSDHLAEGSTGAKQDRSDRIER